MPKSNTTSTNLSGHKVHLVLIQITITKKQTTFVICFLVGGLWDCLESLALDVPTVDCFIIFNYLQSSLRTLLAPRSNSTNAYAFWRVLTLTHSNKKGLGKSQNLFYGASNGLNFEQYCVKLAHYLLHDEYTMNTIKYWFDLAK